MASPKQKEAEEWMRDIMHSGLARDMEHAIHILNSFHPEVMEEAANEFRHERGADL